MDKSRRSSAPWASHSSRRDDKKRDHKDDFDDFVEKKKRELMDFKEDNDRLRADRKRDRAENETLRAQLRKRDAEIANLEQQWRDASERQTRRATAALEKLFAVLVAPAKSEDGDSIDTSNDQGDGAGGEDPVRPTLPEHTAANTFDNGPGNAAPSPEEDEKMQEEALEQAAHHSRTEMPPALGGQ